MSSTLPNSIEILLVEDNPGDVFLTRTALQQSPIPNHLRVVSDGEEAMYLLHKQGRYQNVPRPDLILLDLNLPKKTGREVLGEVKHDPELKQIPVIILTGSSSQEDVYSCYDLYANSYVCKPFDLNDFENVIKTIEKFWISTAILPKISAF